MPVRVCERLLKLSFLGWRPRDFTGFWHQKQIVLADRLAQSAHQGVDDVKCTRASGMKGLAVRRRHAVGSKPLRFFHNLDAAHG